jgi:PAS domain S-box-containing protein
MNILLAAQSPESVALVQGVLARGKSAPFHLNLIDGWADDLKHVVEARKINLILFDWRRVDRRELGRLSQVRAQVPQRIPIVVLAASDDETIALQILQRGAQGYVSKTVLQKDPGLLARSIRSAMARGKRRLGNRKEVEVQARKAEAYEAYMEQVLSSIPSVLISLSSVGLITHWNAVAEATFGIVEAAVLNQALSACDIPWDIATILQGIETCRTQQQPLRLEDTRFKRPNGQEGVLGFTAIPVKGDGQEVLSFVLFGADITERKRAEQREKELAAAAAAAAAAQKRAEELDQAYKKLKQTQAMLVQVEKMAVVGQLAAGVAHELKNPLGIINEGVIYFDRELDQDHGRHAAVLRMMEEAIVRADKIIHGLLNFSKPAQLELKPMAINQVIETTLDLVHKPLAAKNVRITKEFDPDLPLVMIDENQIKQVFVNLFLNALQAMPNGGRLSIRCYPGTLTEPVVSIGSPATGARRPGETTLVCEVRDTGIGIPKEQVSKVFDPFFTTKPPGQGVGLGLSITKSIAEHHGGTIRIESEPGQGTTVIMTLPVWKIGQQAGSQANTEGTP